MAEYTIKHSNYAMPRPIPHKVNDIDEFEEVEEDCSDCKYYREVVTNGTTWVECDLGFMCAKEAMEGE